MRLFETKAYEVVIEDTEKTQFKDAIKLLRDTAREINFVVGNTCPIEVECYTYTSRDLCRAASLLEGLVCDTYRIYDD